MDASAVGHDGPLGLEDPFLRASSSVSVTLQNLEESRARLLHPITPSSAWLASLKPPDTKSQASLDHLPKPAALSFLDHKCSDWIPEQASLLTADAKKSSSKLNPLWLENPFLKEPILASLTPQGLEESRARLLCPLASSALRWSSLKPSDTQFHVPLGPLDTCGTLTSTGFPTDCGTQNEAHIPRCVLEQLQLTDEGEGNEDLGGVMPEYVLTVPEDKLKEQPNERDSSGHEMTEDSQERETRADKLMLLNLVCCSLVEGFRYGSPNGQMEQDLEQVCERLAEHEPEFILKVALYARQELNIRSTANFLLALSSRLLPCRPHLRRYFSHTVQLPSDWMEVARLYDGLAKTGETLAPLPSCLRAAMTDKFRQFDAYQLAKYNVRKSRGKKRHWPKTKKKELEPGCRNRWEKHALGRNKFLASKLKALQRVFDEPSESAPKQPAAPRDPFSLKALIQRLHISQPAQHVMSLLGRRYPSDLHTFSRSRLPGPWDSSLAGTRMKLPRPLTWDRELSQRGNNAKAWEDLIDAGKLPFMAMLRNLRNIVRAGVSERHHRRLLNRLENKESVIRSKQLPFRFLAAYKVIKQLEEGLKGKVPSNRDIIKQILKELRPHLLGRPMRFWTRQELRRCMEVPFIFQLVKCKKKKLMKFRQANYSHAILQRYQQALETAIGIAVRHNVPPIPGRTLILISCTSLMSEPYLRASNLRCPSAEQKNDNKALTGLDMAFLLGSMVYSASEHAQLMLCNQSTVTGPVAMTGAVLQDVHYLQALEIERGHGDCLNIRDVVVDLLFRRQQVDTILLLSCVAEDDSSIWLYRHHVAPRCLFFNVCAGIVWSRTLESVKHLEISGFSEQVLRFMAECGSSRFLEHVGKIDKIHGLPEPRGAGVAKLETGVGPLISVPHSRWRSIKVFVSSTFRDMHGERDLLIRSVFPELRARAAPFCLAIEDIDLRWGITEHEAQRNKQLELCLSEVARSHLFIGILGERYGHIPGEYSLPDELQYEWVKSYPGGRSVTELEAVQFLNGCKGSSAGSRAFFYLREPDFLGSVPKAWKADFAAESEEAKDRLVDLKKRLENHESLPSLSRYTCQWGGVAQGRPYVKSLEDFGARVLRDVWESLCLHFIQGDGSVLSGELEEAEENILQESFQELQQKRFCARAKLLRATAAQLCGGRVCVVSGECGQGKTVFLAALAQELQAKAPPHGDPAPCYHVMAHFTRARPDQANAQVMLGRLCALLRKLMKQPPTPPTSYRGLVGQFNSLLHSVAQLLKRRQSLVVLIDGADLIHAASGQLVSDWLPEQLPQRVSLVLSVSEESPLLRSLKQRKDVAIISLGPLDPPDRAVIIRKDLALYGKKLEESAFNNQMRLVLLKRGSRQPLYLTLLTQDLRLFALYEKLSERIQKLPVSLPLLLQHLLGCLEQDHGLELVAVAFASLWASRDGLTERDLYAVLATWKELNGADINLEEAILAGRRSGIYPMAPFLDFLRSLRGLLAACGSPAEPPGSRLHLFGTPLKTAVERRYLKKPGLAHTAHVLLAAHWWKLSDPDGSRSFRNCEAESLSALPYHLVQSGCLSNLASLLTDLRVVSAHVRLRLLPSLSEAYALYEAAIGSERDETVDSFRDFLQRNMGLLSQNPSLLLQQAANEPDSSTLSLQAQAELCRDGRHFLKWINKPQEAQENMSLVLNLPATPSSASVSPSGSLAAVGTAEGTLHLLDMETGQELKSLLSACDGISACVFLSETSVCLGAFNGCLELWSVREGCRLMGMDAHKAQITDCCIDSDLRLLATVSFDGYLKLWESAHGHLTRERDCSHPLNCAAFHPVGQAVATGGWDRTVTVLDVQDMSVLSELKGHDASIHCITFSPTGNVLAAGTLVGTVCLWSWKESVALGTFSAHSGYVAAAQFLPGGKLITGGEDCKVQVWEGHSGQLWSTLQSPALSPALCIAPNPDGSRLAVGHHSDDVWVYHQPWRSGFDPTHCRANGVAVCSLAWLDNLLLVGGSDDGSLRVWNTTDLQPLCLRKIQGHDRAVTGLVVSKNLMASTSEDFTVRLWLTETLRPGPATVASISPLAVLQGHTAGVTCCAFSPDGCYLATGGKDRALFLWDVRDPSQKTPSLWRSLPFCHQDWISVCAWTGPTLLSGSNDCTVCLWDPLTGKRLRVFLGHQSPICGVTSESDHVISMDREGMLLAWDLQGVEKTRFLAHPGRANHCAGFSDQGEKVFMLAAAGSDGTVNLWKPLTMEQPQVLSGHSGAVCGAAVSSASSSFLTIAEDKTARLWTLRKKDGGVRGFPQHCGVVTAVAWSPEGEFAVSGGERGDLMLWWEGKTAGTAKVGSHCISALAFTSAHTVLVASEGISLWNINTSGCHDETGGLTYRKLLQPAAKASVLCAGTPSPGGPVVLSLTDGDLLVLKPQDKKFWHNKEKDSPWNIGDHVCFDLYASEEGVLHIWESMKMPKLFRMSVTQSGELKDEQEWWDYIPWEPKNASVWITVTRLVKEKFLYFADSEGALWTQTRRPQEAEENQDELWQLDGWQRRKIHDDKITALHILGDKIVTASHDRDVKIWDGSTMKLLGQFRCLAPVSRLQPCPRVDPSPLLIAGDILGNIYFLEWSSLSA
ncbi:telomerase protein component 1 isoform X2 [Eublepharis macularius]|nr:telomerase protein component 1 isoform X2 [Eublepharis macularius]XP_054848406.1 telomerase protein component 1 isoform X2 [Eublepharis macularius]XP_054848407.1 telomerase protein component 1 isoform X2 [Eublepharis macularius]